LRKEFVDGADMSGLEDPKTLVLESCFLEHLEADEPTEEFDKICSNLFEYDKIVFPFIFEEE